MSSQAVVAMDSQDDSLDIAKLQRVALGLEHEPSQPVLDKIRAIGETSHENSKPDQPDQAVFLASLSSASRTDYPPSNPPRPRSRSRSRSRSPTRSSQPNATNKDPSGTGERNGEPASQIGKMSSGEAPGDTQVVSQSVFDSIIRQNKDSSGVEGLENGGNGTFMTLHGGESGPIDLLSGFDNTNADVMHTQENENENDDETSSKLGDSSPAYYEPNLFPESQRFLAPTPARPATQNGADAHPTESPQTSRNPLTGDTELNGGGGVMALSQVFKATQVPSSPLVNNGPQIDPMSDRPSPSLPLHNPALAGAFSSPSMSMPAKLNGKSSEPHYISIEESQAERDKLLGQRMTRSTEHIGSEDQSDSEFNKEPSFVRRLRRQRTIDEEAAAQFASLSAPVRPSSSRSATKGDRPTTPPREESEGRGGDEFTGHVLEYEQQETGATNQHGGTSEEETEQEEDLDRPIHPSQGPQSSTEEDKENYNEQQASNNSAPTSSHDRLTQALGLSGNQSKHDGPEEQLPADFRHPRSPNQDEQVGSSSQAFLVKDSQQSPARQDNGTREEPLSNERPVDPSSRMEMDPSSDMEKVSSSPITKPLPQSTPPLSRRRRDPGDAKNTDTADQSQGENSYDSSNRHGEEMPTHNNHLQTNNPPFQASTNIADNPQGKSSSLLSQIAETSLDMHPRSSRDVAASSVPETSPNRFIDQPSTGEENGEGQNQEDDDLPPMYPATHERASQSGASDGQRPALAAKSILNPKIFSSPSGRARRTLTEIASDPSPQPWSTNYDMNFDILTTEDQEFNSMVAGSPIPPKKRRRRNIDLNISARDPILPAFQAAKPQAAHVEQDETIEESEPAAPPSMTESAPVTQSSPLKRTDTVSDVDVLRRSNVRRVGRPPKSARRRGRPPGHARAFPPKNNVAVVIHNNLSSNASRSPSNRPASPRDTEQSPMDTSADAIPEEPLPPFSDGSQILQNQVLAIWYGQKRAYYAGTCFGAPPGTTPSRYLVRFEDSAAVEIPTSSVKKMELNVGDGVKVDMPNVPKITHIIRGFADRLSEEEMAKQATSGFIPLTDIHGHSSVVLGPKQRKSLPGGGLVGPETVITVPMSKVYLDTILWNQLKDRDFTFNPETTQPAPRQTPSERQSTPTSPSTRSRFTLPSNGLFSDMAFAVSYTENEDSKSRITRLILENGGHILKDGFNELFKYESNVPVASPESTANSEPFRLTSSAEEVGFVCLIADKHSRREKYMQALALNLPCLSGRWIEDCVAQRRALDWGMYLLPAGESLYLDGATKSRLLLPMPPGNARLADTITHRPNLLSGQSVLLVMGRGRAEEKRKAYIFLTYALGASRMERVFDLKSAKAVLDQQSDRGWDWIYVDDDEQDAAKAVILGESTDVQQKTQPGKRGRKRKMPAGPVHSNEGGVKGRIVGNEFLCQSLILGRLFE